MSWNDHTDRRSPTIHHPVHQRTGPRTSEHESLMRLPLLGLPLMRFPLIVTALALLMSSGVNAQVPPAPSAPGLMAVSIQAAGAFPAVSALSPVVADLPCDRLLVCGNGSSSIEGGELMQSLDLAFDNEEEFRSRWLLGASIGFVVGGGAAYLALWRGGSSGMCNQSTNENAIDEVECLVLTGMGGLFGAGIGAMIGSQFGLSR